LKEQIVARKLEFEALINLSSVTKAKMNLKEGTIELEGSEAFVSKYLDEFSQEMKNVKMPVVDASKEAERTETERTKKHTGKGTQTVIPISMDLKEKNGKPSLRDFHKQKNPESLWESVTVFAYYLKEYLKVGKMEAGHVSSCCKEVGIKVPTSISQMFYDIQHQKGWLNVIDGRRFAEINTAGENFVIHDLPRKKDVARSKTST
jgi:hypothetical protein